MAVQPQYLEYVLEQLQALARLSSRRMFGGVGLYSGESFFGLIDDDTLFFKTDASNKAAYLARNMPPFMPFPDRPDAVMGYHQVPADVLEDAEELVMWARRSVAVALAAHAAKTARKSRPAAAKKRGKPGNTRAKAGAAQPTRKKSAPRARRRPSRS